MLQWDRYKGLTCCRETGGNASGAEWTQRNKLLGTTDVRSEQPRSRGGETMLRKGNGDGHIASFERRGVWIIYFVNEANKLDTIHAEREMVFYVLS